MDDSDRHVLIGDSKWRPYTMLTPNDIMESLVPPAAVLSGLSVIYQVLRCIVSAPPKKPDYASTELTLLLAIVGLVFAVYAAFRTKTLRTMLMLVALGGVIVVAGFTSTYYTIENNNFSITLTRADALYFTFGTLTTAGTGNIYARTDPARLYVTAQLIVDIVYAIFVFGLVISRLASESTKGTLDIFGSTKRHHN